MCKTKGLTFSEDLDGFLLTTQAFFFSTLREVSLCVLNTKTYRYTYIFKYAISVSIHVVTSHADTVYACQKS